MSRRETRRRWGSLVLRLASIREFWRFLVRQDESLSITSCFMNDTDSLSRFFAFPDYGDSGAGRQNCRSRRAVRVSSQAAFGRARGCVVVMTSFVRSSLEDLAVPTWAGAITSTFRRLRPAAIC